MIGTSLIDTITTPDGAFMILENEDGSVLSSGWTDSVEAVLARLSSRNRPTALPGRSQNRDAVDAFYSGDVRAIDSVSVRQFGTPLQTVSWTALRRIAPGAPITYTELAARSGNARAVRAAASACARNAPALFVPCHRVITTTGGLAGFAWGIPVKRALLAREAAAVPHE
ncbi:MULTISPECIES: methylated-DNA--[protein]-cysteine S-methyltransferase [unclassified Rathayibacter]|uniref:methylated-DNA--[protein]-cysteine S-methyltransferase n=1 Tax=unclassified Rathayibacter TaxID=2609250 RepID=UPI00188C919D|nr:MULTISPECIES: methylated-DNA--[protein]-cysteine S-methyltransferase [unclassified Rathayibacter]MBF4462608.1 methylated-DNA--[protein]-cysteine S-methyltransferase [Rathayibacter sp. VKM Ac-2879]MBF4503349.1 methylated-DNA--[protein]-cysteine S-methyltransferase [Rathayibacter sp. VKM Ac-2878]